MERIIIIIIFAAISLIVNASKKKTNGSGQRGAAQNGARPAPPQQQMNRPQPTPARRPAAPAPVKAAPQPAPAVLDDTDRMPDHLASGESRECDHGSVGGSMDITSHQGDVNENVSHQRVAISWDDKGAQLISPSRISALDMQRAVVMAEILKSPRERYANRRWPRR